MTKKFFFAVYFITKLKVQKFDVILAFLSVYTGINRIIRIITIDCKNIALADFVYTSRAAQTSQTSVKYRTFIVCTLHLSA